MKQGAPWEQTDKTEELRELCALLRRQGGATMSETIIKHITADDVKRMTDIEGLILQGCGGDPAEWAAGVNDLLTKEGILLDGAVFKEPYGFEHEGHTNILLSMENVKLDIGKLAMWRLKSHSAFAAIGSAIISPPWCINTDTARY
jgi:hypothetical protein